MLGDGNRIGCVVCWLHPEVRGTDIKNICVIFAGSGYCIDHWRAVANHLTEKASHGPVALTNLDSLPLVLAGIAQEMKL